MDKKDIKLGMQVQLAGRVAVVEKIWGLRAKMCNGGLEWQTLDEYPDLKPHLVYSLLMNKMVDIKPRGHHDPNQDLTDSNFYIRRIYKKERLLLLKEDKSTSEKRYSDLYYSFHERTTDKSEYGVGGPDTLKMFVELEKKLEKHKIKKK